MNRVLSVVIPVFNEASTISHVIRTLADQPLVGEIIIVDDASTDDTCKNLPSPSTLPIPFKIFRHTINQGKGAALRTGIAAATLPFVIIQDADLEYDPREYPKILQPLLEDRADVVYGSRFLGGSAHRVLYFWHRVGNGLLTLLSNMCTNLNLTDMETGFKAFRREFIQKIQVQENRFGFEPEITAKLARHYARFYEVGISYSGRTYQEGKKVGWKDGFRALWCIFRYNFIS
ncbi:MAG: glycosyltransferase family 2 protein [Verrucomicrobia bacterium]|nr:glycosyltransferase family 2 protein [Verrucomicrobiota bacterium]